MIIYKPVFNARGDQVVDGILILSMNAIWNYMGPTRMNSWAGVTAKY